MKSINLLAERAAKRVIRAGRRIHRGSYTAGSAVVVLSPDCHVLMLKAIYRTSLGFPGGFKDRSEDPETAARRELAEETGMKAKDLEFVGIRFQDDSQHLDVVYALRDVDPYVAIPRSVEIRSHRWLPLADAYLQLDHDGRAVLDMVVTKFGLNR